jgi:hypothetical protein
MRGSDNSGERNDLVRDESGREESGFLAKVLRGNGVRTRAPLQSGAQRRRSRGLVVTSEKNEAISESGIPMRCESCLTSWILKSFGANNDSEEIRFYCPMCRKALGKFVISTVKEEA